MVDQRILDKYNVAAPRYTSYPTVPYWENELFNVQEWESRVKVNYTNSKEKGISLYIHLPYCESLCTYCGCNTRITKRHSVEEPYIAAVLKEWKMYKEMLGEDTILISEIHLGGGTPTFFSPLNLQRLIEGVMAGNQQVVDASFSFEAHPANTTYAHLQVLYGLGFRRLSLGIQDFDPKVQFVINRVQSVEDVQRVMQQAREIGYTSINFDLIYGLPLQSKSSVRSTLEEAMRLGPDRISYYSYAHVPWIKPGQRRFTEMDLPVGAEKLELYGLGKQIIQRSGYKDVGMDHFAREDDALFVAAREGRLHRNFMGYADRYTPLLIGLGVSSISDSWTAFAQNAKTVEAYYELLSANKLPVVKGHLLHGEDTLIRQYILDMMCRGRIEFGNNLVLNQNIRERLRPLEEDGIVHITTDQVEITVEGRSFLRNVCMAFDERLQQSRVIENTFSQAI